jgi:AcrR family transcriptional regulator
MKPLRMKPKDRKADLLSCALKAAEAHGFDNFRTKHVAELAEVSQALVMFYFSTVKQLRRAVMRAAIKDENLVVLAGGLGCMDPDARKAPPELKEKAVKLLSQ